MHDLNDLYYFAMVVDHSGFAAAERALSALSRSDAQQRALDASRAHAQVANDRDWAAQYFPTVLRARLERADDHGSGPLAARA